MKAIIRFAAVTFVIFGIALVWKTERRPALDSTEAEKEDATESVVSFVSTKNAAPRMEEGWSREKFQEDLAEAFANEDPCAVAGLMRQVNSARPSQFWSAGMAVLLAHTRNRDPLLQELFATERSPIYGRVAEESTRPETRFFNAILQTETFTPVGSRRERNYERGLAELKDLAQTDSDNGAIHYFLAEALRRTGAKKEEVHAAWSQAGKAPKFQPYYQDIHDSLLRASYENPATFAWTYSFLLNAAAPEFGTRAIKYWASDNETGKWIGGKIAKKLIDLGQSYKTNSPGYQYSRVEYVAGQNLRHTLNGLVDSNREEFFKRMKEANEFIAEQPPEATSAEVSIYMGHVNQPDEATPIDCTLDAWRRLFEAYTAKKK